MRPLKMSLDELRRLVDVASSLARRALRTEACFVNHRTVEADVRSIVDEVMTAARE